MILSAALSCVTTSVIAEVPDGEPASIQDYEALKSTVSTFEIATPADLLLAARLSQSGETFAGMMLRLTADIDLNPGWNARVTVVSDHAALPVIPPVEFPGFEDFYGTFDGQDHAIYGVFMMHEFCEKDDGSASFIRYLCGSLINTKFKNCFFFADFADETVADAAHGGLVTETHSMTALIENVYADIDVWARSSAYQSVGGFVGRIREPSATLRNVIYAGKVGNMEFDNTAPAAISSDKLGISQIVGDGNNVTFTITNFSLEGERLANAGTDEAIGKNNSAKPKGLGEATVSSAGDPAGWNFELLPPSFVTVTADSNTDSFEEDTASRVYYYQSITKTNYESYLSALTDAGYTLVKTYETDGRRFDLLENGVYSVFAARFPGISSTKCRARISVMPYGAEQNLVSEATAAGSVTPKLWQLNVDNFAFGQDGGMGYVIRLSDGKFVVIDGGFNSRSDAASLYKILAENNTRAGKPVVAAWFITHLHDDHFGCLEQFAKRYAKNVTVEGFYYHFPTEAIESTQGGIPAAQNSYRAVSAMTAFEGAKRYNKIHTGMTFGFSGATATVLCTCEDVCQSYYNKDGGNWEKNAFVDGNDTSTVIQFTVAGQTILFTGDASDGESLQMASTWSDAMLKADLVQVAHHGLSGLRAAFYETVDPSVALWPQDLLLYEQDGAVKAMDAEKTFYDLYLLHETDAPENCDYSGSADTWIRNNVAETIPAFENVCLTLPYTAGTYSGGSATVDLSAAYAAKSGDPANYDGEGGAREQYDLSDETVYVQSTGISDGTFSLRFLAGFSGDLKAFDKVGLAITVDNGSKSVTLPGCEGNTVYSSVVAAGETVTAESLGVDYLYGATLEGIPESVTFTVTLQAYRVRTDGETDFCYAPKTVTVAVSDGTVTVK